MTASIGPEETTLLAAEKIAAILARGGIDSALIGAVALAWSARSGAGSGVDGGPRVSGGNGDGGAPGGRSAEVGGGWRCCRAARGRRSAWDGGVAGPREGGGRRGRRGGRFVRETRSG
jgi:hypothetical protein